MTTKTLPKFQQLIRVSLPASCVAMTVFVVFVVESMAVGQQSNGSAANLIPSQGSPAFVVDRRAANAHFVGPQDDSTCAVIPQTCPPCQACDCPTPAMIGVSNYARDEYLCDGGDRGDKVTVGSDWSLKGLDLEDTVGHYDSLDGQRIVQPSNRVCIYAPRFAAVRKISGVVAAEKIDAPVAAVKELPHLLLARDEGTATTLQNLQPRRNVGVVVVDSLRDRTRGLTVDNTLAPSAFSGAFAAHEDFQFIRIGKIENSEKARLAINIASARTWASDLGVQVTVGGQAAMIVRDVIIAQEHRSDGLEGKPKLRVVKVASASYARPGDEVEFTIRFDNIGSQPIGNVTLIDNLTSRLEYVPDSAQCNIQAEFKTENNAASSQILRWEIGPPLPAGQGGIIRFKCRVR